MFCYQNDWIPRREDNKPKTIDQIHLEAEQQKSATLLRVQSTPIISEQRLRHRGSVDNWKSPSSAIDASKIRVTRQPTEDNIQLGPGNGRLNFAQWQSGSSGGSSSVSRTPSADREQQARFVLGILIHCKL
jgi:translation initiation factor 4G